MSKKPPSMVEFNFSEDKDPITGEDNPNFIYDDKEEEEELIEEEPIKIQEKEKPNENDIFEDITPKEKVIEKPVEKPVKVKKPRKPMSEEHKKKLALAREKAMAVRKAKAEEKKKMKALENEEKELLKKQKFKKVKKLKEEVESDSPTQESKPSYPTSMITKKDLEEAQLDAIMKYEAIRKERKAKKKEEAMIEEGKRKMLNQINRATGNTYRYRDGSNRFDNCY
tara:strand:- start:2341 stop:3015 length:675 start_codon:yes stop_codon:yes gene_type:complete